MSLITIGLVAALAWVFIMFLSTGAVPEERNDIRSDGTNTLLSSVGYMVVLYACAGARSFCSGYWLWCLLPEQ